MRSIIVGSLAFAVLCAAPGCGGGDDGDGGSDDGGGDDDGGDDFSSEFGDFIASCDLRNLHQCFNWYGDDVSDEELAQFTVETCGPDLMDPCPTEGAVGTCTDPTGGLGIPDGLTSVDVWYAPVTPAEAEMSCAMGGGTWSPGYSP